jgi:hypothetical protein
VTCDWFDKMYPDAARAGIVFTAIGVVTSDPASIESVLAWAARLQQRTEYLIVENSSSTPIFPTGVEHAGAGVSSACFIQR